MVFGKANMSYLIPVAQQRLEDAKKYNQKWFWKKVLEYIGNWINCALHADDHETVNALCKLESEASARSKGFA